MEDSVLRIGKHTKQKKQEEVKVKKKKVQLNLPEISNNHISITSGHIQQNASPSPVKSDLKFREIFE